MTHAQELLQTSWYRNPVFSQLSHDIPVNLQQDKYYSLFCNFLSLYDWTLEGQSPEKRLFCIFQDIGSILFHKGSRVSMTKHRHPSTKVKVKGIDLVWSQIFLLHHSFLMIRCVL